MAVRPLTTTMALLLATVFLLASVLGAFGEAREHNLAKSEATQITLGHGLDCPVCPPPSGDHQQTCDHCLHCPCHAPIGASPIVLSYTPPASLLRAVDSHLLFPEVFLPRFVPPQNS